MNISDRRRAALRRVGGFLLRLKPACETAALALSKSEAPRENLVSGQLMRLMDEAGTLSEEGSLAAMPDGVVVYRDDEVGTVELERDGVTLVLPNETPDDVVDALFTMAALLNDPPMRYTLAGLVVGLTEFVHRPDPQHEKTMAKLDTIKRMLAEGAIS